jgi:hypothetical protein
MAAITLKGMDIVQGRPVRVRSVAAQATTGQTDWFVVPHWAGYMRATFALTASAGTTPIFLPQVVTTDPITLDDTLIANVGGFATSGGVQSTGIVQYEVGPGITGIADATAAVGASGASTVQVNAVLPRLIGLNVLNDRTSGNETYTYTVTVEFREA